MKTKLQLIAICHLLSAICLSAFAQGTAFTYQGRLNSSGVPANGSYDLAFTLFNTNTAGSAIAGPVTNTAVAVTNGLFTTTIDFGPGVFTGATNWLQIGVATNGVSTFTPLSPRQQLTPVPYAIFANTASNLSGTVSAAQISGTVLSANLAGTYGNAVTLNNAGNSFNGTYAGNGANLASLNASQLTSIGNDNGGSFNFFTGSAGNATTSGSYNTANGAGALLFNTTGGENTANGEAALLSNTGGSFNTANGYNTLRNNKTGSDNTAEGVQALYSNASGSDNTAMGELALNYNNIGSGNTAVGYGALYGLTSGTANIAVGYLAGFNYGGSESNNIDIGNEGVMGENNTIWIGTPGIQTQTYIAGVINGNGGGLTNLNAAQLSGTVLSANLSGTYGNAVTLNNAGNSFAGNGAGVTNVNAAALNGLSATNFWQLGGNNISAGQVLGSTNNQPVALYVGNQRAFLIATNPADAPNLIGGSPANLIDAGVEGGVIAGGGTTNFLGSASPNHISANFSSISGGSGNWIQSGSDHALIGAGWNNLINGGSYSSVIAGGENNTNAGPKSVIVGGSGNIIHGTESFIGGGGGNLIQAYDSFIGGGQGNTVSGEFSIVGGGQANTASNFSSTVGGGTGNTASGVGAFIGGGGIDEYSDFGANTASGGASAIVGGLGNTASGDYSFIGGGYNNQATNLYATVPGGFENVAGGKYSFAAGQQAQATNQGAFVWADSQNAPFTSTNNDSFNVRAKGGVRFVTSGAGMTLDGQPVLANNATATLNNLTLTGVLTLPSFFSGPDIIYAANTPLLYADQSFNIFVGLGAGNLATSGDGGSQNTAIGYGTLHGNTSGSGNMATGAGALNINTSGSDNTANGFGALGDNRTGNNNTAVGYNALQQLGFANGAGGSNNIALGYNAGTNFTQNESGNIVIGNAGNGGENDIIRIGTPGIQTNTFIAGVINGNGGGLTNLNAARLSGTLPIANLPAAVVTNTETGVNLSGTFNGNGSGLSLNASQLSSGVVPVSVLPNFQGPSYNTVGGGYANNVIGQYQSTVGGGWNNTASASYATISGGQQNNASGTNSTVGGGYNNIASANNATIPGGYQNSASGDDSFAAGHQAEAFNQGAFVWADPQGTPFGSTATNQFLIRAQGGVGINMNSPNGASLYVQGNRVPTGGNSGWNGFVGWFENTSTATNAAPALRVICDGGTNLDGALSVSSNGKGLIAEFGNSGGFPCVITNDGTIYCKNTVLTSDRALKENFTSLDAGTVLARVAAMPVTEWNYKDDSADKKHIGPMAQDFHAALQLNGGDDKHISTVDEGGVALAAIQGLNQKMELRSQELEAENAELKQRLDVLEKLHSQSKAKLKGTMKTKLMLKSAAALLLLLTLNSQLATARAQGTAFTYQGRLNSSGARRTAATT